jgi:hypothetical protein
MRNPYIRQSLILCMIKERVRALTKLFSGKAAEGIMPLIKRSQQSDILGCIQLLKPLISPLLAFNFSGFTVLINQAGDLLP